MPKESRPYPHILVHLHLYYLDQLDYFIKKLGNIVDCHWDLVVTLPQASPSAEDTLRKFKPDVRILHVENQGYDILPFLQVLYSTNLTQYDYILKLHTKNARKDYCHLFGVKWKGYFWRDLLIEPLLGSKTVFRRNLKRLSNDKAGMWASAPCIIKRNDFAPADTVLFQQVCNHLGFTTSCHDFCAGTMFFIRPRALQLLLQHPFSNTQLLQHNSQRTGDDDTVFHALERIFIPLVRHSNLEVDSLPYRTYQVKRFFYLLTHQFLTIGKENNRKVLWLFGWPIPLKK